MANFAEIQVPPSPNSALVRRIEKVKQLNELENKRKNPADYIWNDKSRMEKFCKKRKKLANDLYELGANTGCYGYLYLSKYYKYNLAMLMLIGRKSTTGRKPLTNTSSGPLQSTKIRIWKTIV